MSKCIVVETSKGKIRIQVAPGVSELPAEDIRALEEYMEYRIRKAKKSKLKEQPK